MIITLKMLLAIKYAFFALNITGLLQILIQTKFILFVIVTSFYRSHFQVTIT